MVSFWKFEDHYWELVDLFVNDEDYDVLMNELNENLLASELLAKQG